MVTNRTPQTTSSRELSAPGMGRTARHLLGARQWQESMSLAQIPSLPIAALAGFQAAFAVLIAIAVTHFSAWSHMVGFTALGALAALFGRYAPLAERRRIVAICALMLTAAVFVTSLVSYLGAPAWAAMVMVALVAGASTVAASSWRLGGPGAVIIVFAAGAALAPAHDWSVLQERSLATFAGGVIAWLVCAATDPWRRAELAIKRHSLPQTAGIPPMRHQLLAAARITLGAGLAALIAGTAGWAHPAWAAIGATAVMQGAHLHVTMSRALQRMAGTMLGALVVWVILANDATFWTVVGFAVLFQFLTEVVIGYNYALGQIMVTPMALLMTYLAAPSGAAMNMPLERVGDTILGAALGIVLAVLFSSADDRAHLAKLRAKS